MVLGAFGSSSGLFLAHFRSNFGIKVHKKTSSESCATISVAKVLKMDAKMVPNTRQNQWKTSWKPTFIHNVQNLDFNCKTAVKTWYLGYRGSRKFMEILWKNSVQIKLNKCMHKLHQIYQQIAQNGTPNHQQIDGKSFKSSMWGLTSQNYAKMHPKVTLRGTKKLYWMRGPWARSASKR